MRKKFNLDLVEPRHSRAKEDEENPGDAAEEDVQELPEHGILFGSACTLRFLFIDPNAGRDGLMKPPALNAKPAPPAAGGVLRAKPAPPAAPAAAVLPLSQKERRQAASLARKSNESNAFVTTLEKMSSSVATSLEQGDPNLRLVLENNHQIMALMMRQSLLSAAMSSTRSVEEITQLVSLADAQNIAVKGMAPKAAAKPVPKIQPKPAASGEGPIDLSEFDPAVINDILPL